MYGWWYTANLPITPERIIIGLKLQLIDRSGFNPGLLARKKSNEAVSENGTPETRQLIERYGKLYGVINILRFMNP